MANAALYEAMKARLNANLVLARHEKGKAEDAETAFHGLGKALAQLEKVTGASAYKAEVADAKALGHAIRGGVQGERDAGRAVRRDPRSRDHQAERGSDRGSGEDQGRDRQARKRGRRSLVRHHRQQRDPHRRAEPDRRGVRHRGGVGLRPQHLQAGDRDDRRHAHAGRRRHQCRHPRPRPPRRDRRDGGLGPGVQGQHDRRQPPARRAGQGAGGQGAPPEDGRRGHRAVRSEDDRSREDRLVRFHRTAGRRPDAQQHGGGNLQAVRRGGRRGRAGIGQRADGRFGGGGAHLLGRRDLAPGRHLDPDHQQGGAGSRAHQRQGQCPGRSGQADQRGASA